MKRFLAGFLMVVMLCGLFTACGGSNETAMEDPNKVPEDPYEIQWYIMADAQNDVASVEAALNEYLKDKINATVKMICLPSAQYTSKLSTMINTGEYFDMAFVARWALDYVGNSRKGAFFDLTDYTNTYLKDISGEIGDDLLRYSYVDGRLYALPVYKEMAQQYGWVYRKDIADKYDIDMSQYKTFEDLKPVLEKIKANEPDMKYPIDWAYGSGDPVSLVRTTNNIFIDGSYDNKPVNKYATPEYKQACETAREFYNEGLVRPDVLTATDQLARMEEGKTFVMLQPIKPGKVEELFGDSKYEFAQVGIEEPIIDYLAGTGSMTAVSSTSKNPARVMRFINLLNSDPYVKNLVVYGVEGKHYKKIDDKTVEPIEKSGYDMYANSWTLGNVFLDYLTTKDDPEKYEKLRAFNEEAKDYPVNAYLPSEITDPAKKQINTEISNTISNYEKQLALGAVDVEPTLNEFLETLEKVGYAERLKDLDEDYANFLKNNK